MLVENKGFPLSDRKDPEASLATQVQRASEVLRGFRARKGQVALKVFKDQRAHAEFRGLRGSMVSMGPIRLLPG